ncbi:MAG: protein kinase, partial [archaeon]|nr:protein kinase [archaeon]
GADLQKACLAAADLRGCLLAGSVLGRPAGVKLQGANLDGAVLDGALLGLGVDLGEYPSLLGHTDAVTSLCFDPRQQLLVSGSLDASIRVWDPAAGPVGQLGAGSNLQKISAIAVQGGRLASAGYDKAIQLWDIDSGEMVAAFRGHNGLICCLLFLSDTELVSGSNDQSLLVWNTSTGQSRPLLGHAGGVWCCSFSPSSGLLSGSSDHAIRLWNLRTSSCESTFIGHTQAVTSVQFAPGGKVFASGSLDRTIYLWSLLRGTPDRTLRVEAGGRINALLFLDSVTLFSGGSDRLIRVWDTETGLCQRSYEGHDWPVASLALHSDGKTLFSGSDDGTIRCWDLETDSCEKTFESHRALVSSVSFTPAGDRLLTASWDKEVRVWELSSLLCVASFSSAKSPINVAKFSSDGNSVFAGTQSNLVYIWSLQLSNNSFNNSNNINNNAEVILQGHNAPINDLVECRNGTLVSCADDRLLIRWSLQTKAKVGVLEGHTEAVSSLAYHPLAEMLASGSSDRTVRIWDLATDQCLRKIVLHSPHAEEVSAVCWDLTGARLLFASCIGEAENTVLRVWNADSLAFESVVQQPHPRRVSAIRQLPDGRVATCSWDRSVKLWESDFSHPQALEGHFGRVWSLDVHPDGLRLVTGSWDQTFRLWAVPPRRSTAAAALLSSQHHHSLRTALQQAHIPLTEDELFSLLPKLASLASLASLTPALAPLACLTSLQRLPLGLVCPTSNPKAESDSDPILRGHMIWQSAPHILSFKGARAVGLENAPVATMQLIQQRGAECEEEAAAEEKGEPPAERRMNMRKMMSASLVLGSSSGGMEARASVAQVLKQPETVKTITAEVTVESVAKFSHVLRIRERSREGDAASSSSSAAAGRAAADSQLNVGDINVVKQLSRGLALGSINGQMVTLRTLSKQDLQPRDQAQMRAVDQVRHVNLVANLTVHATEDFVQIVRPHLRSSLPEAMAKGKLALVVKLRVLRQVAFGLMWLHQNGFQHCNLSFENVLLASEDLSQIAVQLSDYGWPHLAGVLESGGWDARLARVPPEALRSCFQIYTPASDVYAMGMLLYELLTERPVFPECGSLAALKALVVDKLESPQVPQDFPPRLEEVLRRSWAADPSLRPGLEEMVREMDVLICEASVADVLGRKFWRDTFIIGGQIQEEVEWSVFLKAFCEFLGSPMTKEIFSSAGYLKALLCGLDGPSAAQEKVSVERFGKILSWLGPLQGVGIMSEVKELLSKPWFHGFISADDVNNSLKGKQPGTFLLRFSSEPGCYAISAMARDGIKNFRIAHKPGGPYIIGQAQLKSLSEIVSTYSESLGMLTPCPGSPYRDINLSKHSSRSYIIPEWEE